MLNKYKKKEAAKLHKYIIKIWKLQIAVHFSLFFQIYKILFYNLLIIPSLLTFR